LVDRLSGKTTVRTLEPHAAKDVSSVLAIRAVDLLRTSLRELELGQEPPADVAGVDRRPVPKVVSALIEKPPPVWALRIEGAMLFERPSLGIGYGATVGVWGRLSDRMALGITFGGPFVGATWTTDEGSASVHQGIGWAEARVSALRVRPFDFGVGIGAGGHYLSAQGEAVPPLRSRSDAVLSFMGVVTTDARLELTSSTMLVFSFRAAGLAPRPAIGIGSRTTAVELPLLGAAAGLAVGL
jgi:hypothetical protein